MYRITIEKLDASTDPAGASIPTKIYEQVVQELDMRLVMQAVNAKSRKPRAPKKEK